MRRLLKWLGYLLGALVVLGLVGVATVYAVSEYKLSRRHELPPIALSIPGDAEAIEEGKRLATLRGCYQGCHARLEGQVFFDEPFMGRLVAPNLTSAAARYSTEDLARIVRFGIRPDGTSTTGMPSDMFYYLSEADLAKILAFIGNADPLESDLPETRLRLLARLGITLGKFEPDAARVAELGPRKAAPSPAPTAEYGEYLARTVCTECHGLRLEGGFGGQAPPLNIVRGYSRDNFERLMRKGIAVGERELGVMTKVAQYRFSVFTDEEIEALHTFLQTATIPLEDETHAAAVMD